MGPNHKIKFMTSVWKNALEEFTVNQKAPFAQKVAQSCPKSVVLSAPVLDYMLPPLMNINGSNITRLSVAVSLVVLDIPH
jgi:hypothetical protein